VSGYVEQLLLGPLGVRMASKSCKQTMEIYKYALTELALHSLDC